MTANLKELAKAIMKATTSMRDRIHNQRAVIVRDLRAGGKAVVTDERGRTFKVTVVDQQTPGADRD